MRKLFFILLLSSCAFAQTGTKIFDPLSSPVCTPSGTTCPAPRGFNWHYVYDPVNSEVLLLESDPNDPSIYSGAIWAYSTTTHGFTLRVSNGNTAGDGIANCGGWSTAGQNLNPQEGHPLGFFAFDTFRSKAYATGGLCNTKTNGTTSSYNATTRSMDAVILAGQFASCSGGWNCGGPGWSSGMTFVGGSFNKSITCCQNAGGGFFMSEFDGSIYTDITASIVASPRPPLAGTGMVSDGAYLWFFGGCNGIPGNGTGADSCTSGGGTASNDLYRYDPVAKTFTLMSPVGGVKPSATWANFPMVVYDSRRSRLVFYDPGNKLLWQYVIATNTWSQITYSGVLPDQSTWDSTQSAIIAAGTANGAAYDSAHDKMVLIYSVSQSQSIGLYELDFGGGTASTYANLTVQEALDPLKYSGGARTNEPFCWGVALPDNTINSISSLNLSGASAGQFKSIGNWPSGYYKWLKTCGIVGSLSAGGTASVQLTNGGSGNFGGSNLATDNGTTITVATGTSTFTIKKANFNGIDVMDVGTTHVILTGASKGFRLFGPTPTATYPGNVTCSPTSGGTDCSVATGTEYRSSYDSSSTVTVEENGPVMAVLKATWDYKDSAGTHTYQHGMARMYFFKNKNWVKITVTPFKNADQGSSNTFATAFKGLQGIELQLGLNNSGTRSFTIGTHSTSATGTMSGTDDVYLYQGASTDRQFGDNNLFKAYTSDSGYIVRKNGATTGITGTTSGTSAQSPAGWCDIADASGIGLEVGIAYLGPAGSKGCEFAAGGSDVRVGILDTHNSSPYYLEWPQWDETTDLFLNFHSASLSAPNTDFQNWQYRLVARQPVSEYNAAGVFPYPLISGSAQDSYESTTYAAASPASIPSGNAWSVSGVTNGYNGGCVGIADTTLKCPQYVRFFSWNLESEYRWGWIFQYLMRGWTAQWLQADLWYRWQAGYNLSHSDGFNWRTLGPPGNGTLDGFGQPSSSIVSANVALGGATSQDHGNWMTRDSAGSGHSAWFGEMDYYFLSGDEFIKDALIDQMEDYFLVAGAYQDGATSSNTANVDATGKILTMTCCIGSWPAAWIGQVGLFGSSKEPSKIVSVSGATATLEDAITPNQTNALALVDTGLPGTRAIGQHLIGATMFAKWMDAVGESGSATAINQAKHLFELQVNSEVCANGYPAGCDPGVLTGVTSWKNQGVHRKRGFQWGQSGNSGNWCGFNASYRVNSSFQSAIMAEGIMTLANHLGTSWSEYWRAKDLAYGIAKFATTELFVNNNTTTWNTQGFRFGWALDRRNDCQETTDLMTVSTNGTSAVTNIGSRPFYTGGTWPQSSGYSVGLPPLSIPMFVINGTPHNILSVTDANNLTLTDTAPTNASQTAVFQEQDFQYASSQLNVMHLFYILWLTEGSTNWERMFKISMLNGMATTGTQFRDFGNYYENNVIYTLSNPGTKTLQTVPISSFTDNGNGTYSIGWTTPAGTDYLRVKYGCAYKLCQGGGSHGPIVDWIGFDAATNSFTGNASNTSWFAAIDATSIPSPVAGSQSMTVTTGLSGMSINEFSVKAFTSGISSGPGSSGSLMNGRVKLSGKVVVH